MRARNEKKGALKFAMAWYTYSSHVVECRLSIMKLLKPSSHIPRNQRTRLRRVYRFLHIFDASLPMLPHLYDQHGCPHLKVRHTKVFRAP